MRRLSPRIALENEVPEVATPAPVAALVASAEIAAAAAEVVVQAAPEAAVAAEPVVEPVAVVTELPAVDAAPAPVAADPSPEVEVVAAAEPAQVEVEAEAQAAIDEAQVVAATEVAGLEPAQEGIKGTALGFVAGFFGWGTLMIPAGAVANHTVKKMRAEIEHLAHQIELAAADNGARAVKEGKISSDDFRKNARIGIKGIISGAVLGGLFGPIYGAIKGNQLEDLSAELKDKCKQLDRILAKAVADEAAGKKVSTESEELPVVEATQAAEADEGDTVEPTIVLIGEQQDEMEELAEQVEIAGDVVEALESLADVLNDGPVSVQTARAVKIATESLYARVGIQAEARMPALESFQGEHASVSTTIAMESILGRAQKVWEAIVKAMRAAIEWVKNWIRSLLDGSKALQAKAAALAKELDDLEAKPESTSFKSPQAAVKVQHNGAIPKSVSEIAYGSKTLLEAQLNRISHEAVDAEQLAHQLVKGTKDFKFSVAGARKASGLNRSATLPGGFFNDKVIVSEMLLGGKLIIQKTGIDIGIGASEKYVNKGLDAVQDLMNTPYLFEATMGGPTFKAFGLADSVTNARLRTIPTPSHEEMKACTEAAGAMALGVSVFRSTISKLEALCDGFAKQAAEMLKIETPVKNTGELDTKRTDREAKQIAQKFYTQAPRMFIKEPAAFASEQLRIANNLLFYVRAGMSQYKRKPGAKPVKPEMTPGGQRLLAA